ncbi:hypothetical protein TNIN_411221 [Trichonephila inaurata madagascariensis]|uniref:Uncharacterized protein n=1 Tax=Trichonephila inaurata madagascariensis TaxID=2747483 RepID=A0A8X6WTK6_9ARAC|nr:hypothetical protein TNIN_411221 [Trichonephila inaurata madagascariensis]
MNACIQVTQRAANKDAKRKKGSDLELQDSILSLPRERDDSPAGRITHVQLPGISKNFSLMSTLVTPINPKNPDLRSSYQHTMGLIFVQISVSELTGE